MAIATLRRLAWRLAPVALLAGLAVACFDESSYEGGGRRDQRAETNQQDEEDSGILPAPGDGGSTNLDTGSPPETGVGAE